MFIYIHICMLLIGVSWTHLHKCKELLMIIIIPWKLDSTMCFASIYLCSLRINLAFFSGVLNSHCS